MMIELVAPLIFLWTSMLLLFVVKVRDDRRDRERHRIGRLAGPPTHLLLPGGGRRKMR